MIAHSFGNYLAMKLTCLLEALGKKVFITNIDGAPDVLSYAVQLQIENKTENEYYDYVLCYTLSVINQNIDKEMLDAIITETSWDTKIVKFIEYVSTQKGFNPDQLRSSMKAVTNRGWIMMNDTGKLGYLDNTKCALIKPSDEMVVHSQENYGLNKFFKQDVKIINLEGNHHSVLENPKLSQIVNELHSQI
jgi:fatty acid synthase